VEQFNWTDAARKHLAGVTLADVADVLYADLADRLVRRLSTDGRIVMGRTSSGVFVAVLLIRNAEIVDMWDISFARQMTEIEVEEWQRWKKQ
jgi:hypothetical protein